MTNLNQEKLEISDIINHVNRAVELIEADINAVDFLKRLARMLETQEELIDEELFAEYQGEEELIDPELLLTYEEDQEDEDQFAEYIRNSQTKTLRQWNEQDEDQEMQKFFS